MPVVEWGVVLEGVGHEAVVCEGVSHATNTAMLWNAGAAVKAGLLSRAVIATRVDGGPWEVLW